MHHSASFPKSEHLCLKSTFDQLFESGNSFYCHSLKIVWFAKQEEKSSFQIAFTVSKRHFKKAVDRNFLKRRMREAFRLNNQTFKQQLTELNLAVSFIFIYTRKERKEYHEIEENVIHSLLKLEHELSKWKKNTKSSALATTNGSDSIN